MNRKSEDDLRYIAGFFDGEGNIGIPVEIKKNGGNPYHCLRITIANTNRDILEWMKTIIGGNIFNSQRKHQHHRQGYMLILSHVVARRFLLDITPYLKVKKRQAEIAASLYHTNDNPNLTDEEIARRDEIRKIVNGMKGRQGKEPLNYL